MTLSSMCYEKYEKTMIKQRRTKREKITVTPTPTSR